MIKTILSNPLAIFNLLICKIKSAYYSSYIDGGKGKFIVQDPNIGVKIIKGKGARIIIDGIVTIGSHIGGNSLIVINLGANSKLEIAGDFIIGNGVKLAISDNAILSFGGKNIESGSGITADTMVMCNKRIDIGKDFLCAWGVFISDSDWHSIGSQHHQGDVIIGDHVWIANNSNVLKGSVIGNNCIIASQSKVANKVYPPNSLLAGTPARVVKSDISWKRDV